MEWFQFRKLSVSQILQRPSKAGFLNLHFSYFIYPIYCFLSWMSGHLWLNIIVIWKTWNYLLSLVSDLEWKAIGSSYHTWHRLDLLEHERSYDIRTAASISKISDGNIALHLPVWYLWFDRCNRAGCIMYAVSVITQQSREARQAFSRVLAAWLLFFPLLEQIPCFI